MPIPGLRNLTSFGLLAALSCSTPAGDPKATVTPRRPLALEVVSVPWDIETRTTITEKTIVTLSFARRLTVTDREALEDFGKRLRGLRVEDRPKAMGSVRIFAQLKYSEGPADRLAVSESCQAMVRNGSPCAFEPRLFEWLVSRLAADEREALSQYRECRLARESGR